MLEIGHIIHRINVNTYNAYVLVSICSVKEGDENPYIEYHFKCNNPLSDFTWWKLRSDDPYIVSIIRDKVLNILC